MFSNSVHINLKTNKGEVLIHPPVEKKVLALVGTRKSGKSTAANLVMALDSRFVKRSFADPLRQMFSEYKNVDIQSLLSNTKKEEYRREIIDFSWKVKRDKGLFHFAETFFNNIDSPLTVCDDLRNIEELQLLVLFGGVAYKIYSPDHLRRQRGWVYDPIIDEEQSEIEIGSLCASTLYFCTGGGCWYNTKDERYLEEQIAPVLPRLFPQSPSNKEFPDLEQMMSLKM